MTLHDIAAQMRMRFMASGGEVPKKVSITAEEWTLLAKALYRDPTTVLPLYEAPPHGSE